MLANRGKLGGKGGRKMHFVANKKPIFKGRSDFFRRYLGLNKNAARYNFAAKKSCFLFASLSPERKEDRQMGGL